MSKKSMMGRRKRSMTASQAAWVGCMESQKKKSSGLGHTLYCALLLPSSCPQ